MAYVYRHIRLDKNEPFYIGIGVDKHYRRAFKNASKNRFWNNVVAKTDYLAEILFDDVTRSFAENKEKEFIKLYGRRDLGLGPLVNLTDGGEGNTNWSEQMRINHIMRCKNRVVSEETRRKQSVAQKGKKQSKEQVEKRMATIKRNGITITKETREKMASKLRGRPQPEWQRKILSEAAKGKKVYWSYVPIYQFDYDGNFIKEYESIKAAAKELKLQPANIGKVLSGKRRHTGYFCFKYKLK